jgi:hypothetical protein
MKPIVHTIPLEITANTSTYLCAWQRRNMPDSYVIGYMRYSTSGNAAEYYKAEGIRDLEQKVMALSDYRLTGIQIYDFIEGVKKYHA